MTLTVDSGKINSIDAYINVPIEQKYNNSSNQRPAVWTQPTNLSRSLESTHTSIKEATQSHNTKYPNFYSLGSKKALDGPRCMVWDHLTISTLRS